MTALGSYVAETDLRSNYPWDHLVKWSETALTVEGQELVAWLILEPYGDLVDGLAEEMGACPLSRCVAC